MKKATESRSVPQHYFNKVTEKIQSCLAEEEAVVEAVATATTMQDEVAEEVATSLEQELSRQD